MLIFSLSLIYKERCKCSPPLVTQRPSVRRSEEGHEKKQMLNRVHHFKKNLRNYGCNMPFSRNLQNSHLLPSMLASPNMRFSTFFQVHIPIKKKTQVGISKIPSHKVSATWPTPLGVPSDHGLISSIKGSAI